MPNYQSSTSVAVKQQDIHPHMSFVTQTNRNRRQGHKSSVIWLTGLSGAGKSTISSLVERELFNQGYLITVLDGDTMRAGLNSDLDFSKKSREENLRRAGEVATLFANTGHIVLATFISPYQEGREYVRKIVGDDFYLVHVEASLDDCIHRDPKGLYKKALSGGIENFTGIGQGYEDPEDADLIINTSKNSIQEAKAILINFIESVTSLK
jgi:adenylyl-sulfate kinase